MTYKISDADKAKLDALANPKVMQIIEETAAATKPAKVVIFDDSAEDTARVRQLALKNNEEKLLSMDGHTIHYDGYFDQGRDKANTATLLPAGQTLSRGLNVKERDAALEEMWGLLDGIMEGKEMIVRFYSLGPTNSRFSLSVMQITDSYYVVHSEDVLYRPGYEQFKKLEDKDDFFCFRHSAGELENNVTKNIDKRRIYINPADNCVMSVNNQYAGNSLACKKLALRLAINKANKEDWLAEHMFISAFYPLDESRKTYFMGAYPSGCGKTSTAMIEGSTIVGDDIAYIREGAEGEMRAVNIERGIFGIIGDVNAKDDPLIYKAITEPKEIIFSNILTTADGKTYWSGMGKDTEIPEEGFNHSGAWKKGNEDDAGKEIPMSHPNSRFTLRISDLENADENADNPDGVAVDGIFYGGRDSDTNVPVAESLSWEHGVFVGATIESETTATILGAVGQRKSSPMANMDFVIVPLSRYLTNHIKFGNKLKRCPKVFSTNYFLKNEDGQYMNEKTDKRVWALWAEGRVHDDYEAISTPIGLLPKYEDLKVLFDGAFDDRDYTLEEYNEQFSIRIDKYLAKLDRMEELFSSEENMPEEFWTVLKSQRAELKALAEKSGAVVTPATLA
ncbi:MAG: phosphoenolpyruvate carboxykinase (GTP) [Anaerolineae bacterium]|jgi:phosphoenolpyruvate carboxykinase (GTP)|nr:phosphoenolpyruvate carboxykinase (GTP) [Anaerolineae bacterium]MBT3713776.1 phosphoenolpyruvate carboxykinase (GTP) [Anaerolineae bacterium]MBT4309924.1 phosphoenolpyruvate carboxykinase (GTP) [Anaerolineae bacterium]MBT4456798.1 phosphoenolpyruvate carboxykinase (GTP) [Anaerolineae bacterium]MBT4842152.1 phosphoenolpyruvate carboxykinase (GTP) [Anaerolineae bacterium]